MALGRFVFLAVVVVVCLLAGVTESQRVSDAMVERAVNNPRFMRRQISCILNEQPCDNVGQRMRQMLPGLLRGQCTGCTQQQHQQAMRVMSMVSQQYPQEYRQMYSMYGGAQG